MIGGQVLDTSALTDAATGRSIYARAMIRTAVEVGIVLAVPAAALMQAYASVPVGGRPFLDLLLELPVAVFEPLDQLSLQSAGVLLADAGAGDEPHALATAHTALVAQRRGWPVVTANGDLLQTLVPELTIELLP